MVLSQRIAEFDVWRSGYSNAIVTIRQAGTTTLAPVFYDPSLTIAAPNPITLDDKTVDGVEHGRFPQPLYVGTPYQLLVNGAELTGVQLLPLSAFDGADASTATVLATRGSTSRALRDWADDEIRTKSWGELGPNATTNTAIIAAAIGAASAQGGGNVLLPPGAWDINTLSLPYGVILCGDERAATTLRSIQTEEVITLAGDRCGLRNLTIDGLSLLSQSIGIYAVGRTGVVLDGVLVKRFEQGIETRGLQHPRIRDFSIANCERGWALLADTDASNGAGGSGLALMNWAGGEVSDCTEYGVRVAVVDAEVLGIEFDYVQWTRNIGPALQLEGVQFIVAQNCLFSNNTAALRISDGTDADETPSQIIKFTDTRFFSGTLTFEGVCDGVIFDKCEFISADFVLAAPTNMIQLLDCIEDTATTSTGNVEKLGRSSSFKLTEAFGVTTDATVTTAWSMQLAPGEVVRAEARIIAKQRNGTGRASYGRCVVAGCAGSTVTYDQASEALPVGATISGATSEATARVVANSQTGTTGTLTLRDIVGNFVNGETGNFSTGQTARLTGTLAPANASLLSAVETRAPDYEADAAWDVTFDANSTTLRLRVTGEAGKTIEWSCELDVFRA